MLKHACEKKKINFEFQQLLLSGLGEAWEFPDPFYETRPD
jgi:hypothetical protein